MSESTVTLPVATVGMRVRVVVVADDPGRDLRGEIVRLEPFEVDGEVWSTDYPTIRLDDGREVGGIECFWTEDWEAGPPEATVPDPAAGRERHP